MIALMNTPRLTAFGTYEYVPATRAEVWAMLQTGFTSYIGHAPTAQVLSEEFGFTVAHHRGDVTQQPGDVVIVVALNTTRLPEGAILDAAAIRRIGYQFGVLRRLS